MWIWSGYRFNLLQIIKLNDNDRPSPFYCALTCALWVPYPWIFLFNKVLVLKGQETMFRIFLVRLGILLLIGLFFLERKNEQNFDHVPFFPQ